MTKNRIPIKNMSKEDWLGIRRQGIGGSDASVILGMNQRKSPYTLWAEKTETYIPPDTDNETLRQGRDLEGYVAWRFMEATGKKVKKHNFMEFSEEHPFMFANVDRLVVGEKAGLECKTTSSINLKKFKNGEFPDQYYAQCVHYLAVTGLDRWYLAVVILGRDFKWFVIERDEEEIQSLIEAETKFWNNVITNQPPDVDGFDSTTDTIRHIYAEDHPGEVDLFGREGLIQKYLYNEARMKDIKKENETIKQELMLDLGDNEVGYTDNYKVTWKSQGRSNFDKTAFMEAYPIIPIDSFYKKSSSRIFKIRELKGDK